MNFSSLFDGSRFSFCKTLFNLIKFIYLWPWLKYFVRNVTRKTMAFVHSWSALAFSMILAYCYKLNTFNVFDHLLRGQWSIYDEMLSSELEAFRETWLLKFKWLNWPYFNLPAIVFSNSYLHSPWVLNVEYLSASTMLNFSGFWTLFMFISNCLK